MGRLWWESRSYRRETNMKIFVLVGAFVAGALAVPEAKADAEADPWGVYGGYGGYYGGYRGYGLYGYGKRDAEPTAEPTADAEADADAWYGYHGYGGYPYYSGYRYGGYAYRPYGYYGYGSYWG